MAKEQELRKRVERLCGGNILVGDLDALLLSLRFRSYGVASVKELGNFLGHAETREWGLVTDEAKDIFRFFRTSMPFWWDKKQNPCNLHPGYSYFVRQNFSRLSSDAIRDNTGLKRKQALALLESALSKISERADGGEAVIALFTKEERDLVNFVYRTVTLRPLFTDDTLFRDFVFVLEKNSLLRAGEKPLLSSIKPHLALRAVTAMNQTTVVLDNDQWSASLHCSLLNDDARSGPFLGVSAGVEFAPDLKGIAGLSYPIYSTKMRAAEWCSPEVMQNLTNRDTDLLLDITAAPLLALM